MMKLNTFKKLTKVRQGLRHKFNNRSLLIKSVKMIAYAKFSLIDVMLHKMVLNGRKTCRDVSICLDRIIFIRLITKEIRKN